MCAEKSMSQLFQKAQKIVKDKVKNVEETYFIFGSHLKVMGSHAQVSLCIIDGSDICTWAIRVGGHVGGYRGGGCVRAARLNKNLKGQISP